MTGSVLPTQVSASDRLGLTLFFAAALHALIILGVTFDLEDFRARDIPLSLEITLVHSSDKEKPDDADYLAQANQAGGGNVEEKLLPSSPAFNPRPNNERGDAQQSIPLAAPESQPELNDTTVMTASVESREKLPQPKDSPQQEVPDTPVEADLLMHSRAIARISANIEQRKQTYAQRKRVKTLTAATKEYRYAAYMDAWRQKVERIGNLNYPDEAKRRSLNGHLTLSVELKADGSVQKIEVLESSGHGVLDDGAIRIVKMASPFSEFPPEMRKETDVLRIVRVWQFQNDNFQQSRN